VRERTKRETEAFESTKQLPADLVVPPNRPPQIRRSKEKKDLNALSKLYML
jgi:hypothetical protein